MSSNGGPRRVKCDAPMRIMRHSAALSLARSVGHFHLARTKNACIRHFAPAPSSSGRRQLTA